MKFRVNENCIGCGLCAASCPTVFTMNDDNVAIAPEGDVNPDSEDQASEAADACPVSAIEKE